MNNNLTDITVVLDRSGSMMSVFEDTIGGFDSFVKNQKEQDGQCQLTLIQFDSQDSQEIVYKNTDISNVPSLRDSFGPRAGTPLNDAIGQAIVNTVERLKGIPARERPGKVLFVIITDGYENQSREYNRDQVRKMISVQTDDYNWGFVYIGSTIDAEKEGMSFGIRKDSILRKSVNQVGEAASYRALSSMTSRYRSTAGGPKAEFTIQEKSESVSE